MKFKDLAYSKDEEVFLFYTESQIQFLSTSLTGYKLSQKELRYLKERASQEIANLIIKIESSGVGK